MPQTVWPDMLVSMFTFPQRQPTLQKPSCVAGTLLSWEEPAQSGTMVVCCRMNVMLGWGQLDASSWQGSCRQGLHRLPQTWRCTARPSLWQLLMGHTLLDTASPQQQVSDSSVALLSAHSILSAPPCRHS